MMGLNFISFFFKKLASKPGCRNTTTSPHYPQANGKADSSVESAKTILQQNDVFVALMAFLSTSISESAVTPAELIIGFKMQINVPAIPSTL